MHGGLRRRGPQGPRPGVALSDRRAVKVLKLVAASAVLCGRAAADPSDLWVLRYVWDREEQIGPLAALVSGLLERRRREPRTRGPPGRSTSTARRWPASWSEAEQTLARRASELVELARLRERVAAVADRAAWVADAAGRDHLLGPRRRAAGADRMTDRDDPVARRPAARLPAAGLAALAPVRTRPDVRVHSDRRCRLGRLAGRCGSGCRLLAGGGGGGVLR